MSKKHVLDSPEWRKGFELGKKEARNRLLTQQERVAKLSAEWERQKKHCTDGDGWRQRVIEFETAFKGHMEERVDLFGSVLKGANFSRFTVDQSTRIKLDDFTTRIACEGLKPPPGLLDRKDGLSAIDFLWFCVSRHVSENEDQSVDSMPAGSAGWQLSKPFKSLRNFLVWMAKTATENDYERSMLEAGPFGVWAKKRNAERAHTEAYDLEPIKVDDEIRAEYPPEDHAAVEGRLHSWDLGLKALNKIATPSNVPENSAGMNPEKVSNGPETSTSASRREMVNEFLEMCNRDPKMKISVRRKHIWMAAGHTYARQFEYWQKSDASKATDTNDRTFRRILGLNSTEFKALLQEKRILNAE